MKIAHYDETTKRLLGWYDENIHTSIPTPNVEVSDEDWNGYLGMANLVLQDNNTFVSVAPPKTYDELISDINNWYEAEVAKLTKGVPNTEISTWDKQESEARAYLADVNTSTPFIDSLVLARGVTKEYLVTKIIEKADLYAQAVGALTGERQRQEDELGA